MRLVKNATAQVGAIGRWRLRVKLTPLPSRACDAKMNTSWSRVLRASFSLQVRAP